MWRPTWPRTARRPTAACPRTARRVISSNFIGAPRYRRAKAVPPKISVVVPVYGCERCLRDLHARCVAALEPLVGDALELLLVNDHSPQGDWAVVADLA